MSSDPQARGKCSKRWEEEGETKVEKRKKLNKRKKHDNMASGHGWCSKLWIAVNGEALIGIELLSFSRNLLEHSLTQRHI